ncbi:MltA-interacting protein MipA [compost metagenome]
MSSRLLAAACVTLALLSAAPPAFARSDAGEERVVVLGAAAVYRPEYKGADDYEFQPFPYLSVRYPVRGMSLSLQGADLKLDILDSETVSFGPVLSYEQGRDDDISNEVVRRLATIDGAFLGGVHGEIERPLGRGALRAGATILTDLSGVHEGYSATLHAGYRFPLTSKLSAGLGGHVKWADENYMQTYYGVTASGAVASGLSAYRPESGLERAGVDASLTYRLTEKWGVALIASFDRLSSAAADSPIVLREGAREQYTSAFALFYRF